MVAHWMLRAAVLGVAMTPIAHSADVPALPDGPHVVVIGTGSAEADPDSLELWLWISHERSDGPAAKAAVDEPAARAVSALRDLGLDEEQIEPGPLSLRRAYDELDDGTVRLRGFAASREIKVTITDFGHFDAVVDAAVNAGVTGIGEPSSQLDHEADLKTQARTNAIEDARTRAEALAAGVGLELGPVYGVATSSARRWSPYGYGGYGGGGSGGGGSMFGSPDEDSWPEDLDVADLLSYTPRPVVVRTTVYMVFHLKE